MLLTDDGGVVSDWQLAEGSEAERDGFVCQDGAGVGS